MKDISNNIFIIAGMPRTGTTFLYHNLRKHPSVFLPYRKETNYFSFNFDKGFNWYQQLYKDINPEEFWADINPSYFMNPDSIERIKSFNSNAKIILAVRDPADWALSFYSQFLYYDWRVPSFRDFLEGYLWKIGDKKLHIALKDEFIIYSIEKYRESFGDNLLLYQYSLFKKNPLDVLRSIEYFVGLPPYFKENNFDNIVINAGNRRNIKIISYLISREELISLLKIMFPRQSLQFLQGIFSKISKKKEGHNLKVYTQENIQLAQDVFWREQDYVKKIFFNSKIQLGSGSTFKFL